MMEPMNVAKQNIDAIIKQYSESKEWREYLLEEMSRHGFLEELERLRQENDDLRALCAVQKKQMLLLERTNKYGTVK